MANNLGNYNEGELSKGRSLLAASSGFINVAQQLINECRASLDSSIRDRVNIENVSEEQGSIKKISGSIVKVHDAYMQTKKASEKIAAGQQSSLNKPIKGLNAGDTLTLNVNPNSGLFGDRISSNAYDASRGDFIPEGNVFKEYWADDKGQLQFTKREDGTYLITKNGVPMGYTDEAGLMKIAMSGASSILTPATSSVIDATKGAFTGNTSSGGSAGTPSVGSNSESNHDDNTSLKTNSTLDDIERKIKNGEDLSVGEVKKLYDQSYAHHMFEKDFNRSRELVQEYLNSPTWDKMSEKIQSGQELTNAEKYKLYMSNSTPIELQNPYPFSEPNKAQEAMIQNGVKNGEVEAFMTGTRGEWTGYDFLLKEGNQSSGGTPNPSTNNYVANEKGITREDMQRKNLPY